MHSLLTEAALSAASGVLVGFSLGLVGGGGSILAVPLLVYVVGLNDPHVAIGTSAIAVAVNAAANLVTHARSGNVKWRCATIFASAGVVGAYLGSTLGKIMDGQRLLALFAVLMIVVGGLMLRNRADLGDPGVRLSRENLPKLIASGLGVGVLSGFFGIGGGFLIVPALVMATGMPMLNAIGSSLVAVATFGLTTAANYAVSGLIDRQIAFLFVTGGIFGGLIGARLAKSLGSRRGLLTSIFSGLIFAVAIYVLFRYLSAT